MTLLERLYAHKGRLIRLKTELFWYNDAQIRDNSPGRICLLLDSADYINNKRSARTATAGYGRDSQAAAYLLIDGSPHWVWLYEDDIEFLNAAR